jgi:hypothetical protein
LEALVTNLDTTAVHVAALSTERNNDEKNHDRLRTMFEKSCPARKGFMIACQIVDSPFLWKLLCGKIDMTKFMEGYIVQ